MRRCSRSASSGSASASAASGPSPRCSSIWPVSAMASRHRLRPPPTSPGPPTCSCPLPPRRRPVCGPSSGRCSASASRTPDACSRWHTSSRAPMARGPVSARPGCTRRRPGSSACTRPTRPPSTSRCCGAISPRPDSTHSSSPAPIPTSPRHGRTCSRADSRRLRHLRSRQRRPVRPTGRRRPRTRSSRDSTG